MWGSTPGTPGPFRAVVSGLAARSLCGALAPLPGEGGGWQPSQRPQLAGGAHPVADAEGAYV